MGMTQSPDGKYRHTKEVHVYALVKRPLLGGSARPCVKSNPMIKKVLQVRVATLKETKSMSRLRVRRRRPLHRFCIYNDPSVQSWERWAHIRPRIIPLPGTDSQHLLEGVTDEIYRTTESPYRACLL